MKWHSCSATEIDAIWNLYINLQELNKNLKKNPLMFILRDCWPLFIHILEECWALLAEQESNRHCLKASKTISRAKQRIKAHENSHQAMHRVSGSSGRAQDSLNTSCSPVLFRLTVKKNIFSTKKKLLMHQVKVNRNFVVNNSSKSTIFD